MSTMPKIRTAETFIAFMEQVWRMESGPARGGGITLGMPDPDLYETFHNARRTAAIFGAHIGRAQYINGQTWITADMPHGGRVYISADGSGVRPVKKHSIAHIAL